MSDSWIDDWLGTPRFQRYIDSCSGDRERAFALYAWNVDLSLAFLRDISAFEVALRNAYDLAITRQWHGSTHWLLDYDSPFLQTQIVTQNRKMVDQSYIVSRDILHAVERAGGSNATPGKIVAELSFGFWTRLTEARYEKHFWVPYISTAYPKSADRSGLNKTLYDLRQVRNRIAHHEPIFDYRNAHADMEAKSLHPKMMTLFHQISSPVAAYVDDTSIVIQVLSRRPLA